MSDVAAFRDAWRAEHVGPRYRGALHFASTTAIAFAGIVFAISRVHDVRPLEWVVLPVGFVIANLAEYLGHKGPMHHRTRGLGLLFARHTLQHHAFFTADDMAAPSSRDWKAVLFPWYVILFFLGALATPIALIVHALFGANAGWLFAALGIGYFLAYEWLHLAYHQPSSSWVGRLGVVRALSRHHARHHDARRMTAGNFNITIPLFDAVFGTILKDPPARG